MYVYKSSSYAYYLFTVDMIQSNISIGTMGSMESMDYIATMDIAVSIIIMVITRLILIIPVIH